MAYNEDLEARISVALEIFPSQTTDNISKKKMFGGLAFLFHGKMTVGIVKDDLTVRVVAEKMDTVLNMEDVRPMDFTNRPMKEFIFVSPNAFKTDEQLQNWIALGLEHATSKLKIL